MIKDRGNQGKIAEKAMNEAIKEATDRQLKLGVPVVFIKDGKICYKMPDGTLSDTGE